MQIVNVDLARSRRLLFKHAPRRWWLNRSFTSRLMSWTGVTTLLPDPNANARCLDVGCGDRPFDELLTSRGHDLYGVDPISSAADVTARGEALPFPSDSFGAAICAGVLEYVDDPERVCREIGRVLGRDGVLVVRVVANAPLDPAAQWRWTDHSVAQMLVGAGFTDVVVVPLGSSPATLLHLSALGLRQIPLIGRLVGVLVELFAYLALRSKDRRFPMGYAARGIRG